MTLVEKIAQDLEYDGLEVTVNSWQEGKLRTTLFW